MARGSLLPLAFCIVLASACESRNFDRPSIINVNVAIATAARVLNVQTVLTTVEKKGFSGCRSAIASVGTRRRRGVGINA